MSFAAIEELLADRIGLDPRAFAAPALHAEIDRCRRDAGFVEPDTYASALRSRPDLCDALVEGVIVPESWFFRDQAPYEYVRSLAAQWIGSDASRRRRILSAPCGGGEEPYSIAIALLDAGFPAARFSIDAVDVSARQLERARAAAYDGRAFRSDLEPRYEQYFDRRPSGATSTARRSVRSFVKDLVSFDRVNLACTPIRLPDIHYDLIFFRNLIIYLRAETRESLIGELRRRLAPGGAIVVGHAEAGVMSRAGLRTAGPPAAFAFRA